MLACGINIQLIVRGSLPTPVSAILVKPDGKRALINYKGETKPLPSGAIDFSSVKAKVILFDGHEPYISLPLAERACAVVITLGEKDLPIVAFSTKALASINLASVNRQVSDK